MRPLKSADKGVFVRIGHSNPYKEKARGLNNLAGFPGCRLVDDASGRLQNRKHKIKKPLEGAFYLLCGGVRRMQAHDLYPSGNDHILADFALQAKF